jgi:hypothetical protein
MVDENVGSLISKIFFFQDAPLGFPARVFILDIDQVFLSAETYIFKA